MTSSSKSSASTPAGWTSIAVSVRPGDLERWCAAIEGDVCWFDSAIGHRERGRRSMLVLESTALLHDAGDRFDILNVEGQTVDVISRFDVWAALDRQVSADREHNDLHGYPAGVVGYISYEAAQLCDDAFPEVSHAVPPLQWSYVLAAVVIEDEDARLVTRSGGGFTANTRINRWLNFLRKVLTSQSSGEDAARHVAEAPILSLDSDEDFEQYSADIRAVMGAIRDGRYYQACLTYPITFGRPRPTVLECYRQIRSRSPGDYGGYFRWDDVELACSSPEEFMSFRGRTVRARPMKGTRRRARGRENEQIDELRSSAKDRAENVMIVDLLRNDLGRSAAEGTVSVENLCDIEIYETVLQMTSTVTATLRQDVGVFEAVGKAFPPGSMTGAPKIEACHHLSQLEPEPRGLYAGSIGWVGYDDRAVFNVVIRSLQAWGERATWNTGGGIVADSDAHSEWEETRTKASPALSLSDAPPIDD